MLSEILTRLIYQSFPIDIYVLMSTYVRPLDDIDGFIRQLEQSLTDILDALTPLKKGTKRCGKADSRRSSNAAVSAKQKRRQLDRRLKRNGSEADRVEYRMACRVANATIHFQGQHSTTYVWPRPSATRWRWDAYRRIYSIVTKVAMKETSSQEAQLLCDSYQFFHGQIEVHRANVNTQLKNMVVYHLLVESSTSNGHYGGSLGGGGVQIDRRVANEDART